MRDIGDYAFLSDCQSGALVSREGSVDWLCFPRFDSPSIFCRLLDPDGGYWSIRPSGPFESRRAYDPDSLVLRTTFVTGTGTVELSDALLFKPDARGHEIGQASPHVLVREVRGVQGSVEMRTDAFPRPEYEQAWPIVRPTPAGAEAVAGAATLQFRSTLPIEAITEQGAVRSRFAVAAGERQSFTLAYRRTWDPEQCVAAADVDYSEGLEDTLEGWRSWAADHWGPDFGYHGEYAEHVRLSALVMQGLTYQPSGAVVAALTTSLPERTGGEWNWDYRYAWLRDAAFMMRALWIAACPTEPEAFFHWISRAAGRGDDGEVQIVYGIEGERDLTERTLEHLAGFEGSVPVRIGNRAWTQRQLDVLGEVLDAAVQLDERVTTWSPDSQQLLCSFADFAAGHWSEPDAGMWEARMAERHYTSSKVMCWVALDRAVRLAARIGADEAQCERWAAGRDAIRTAILERAWVPSKRSFGGALGSDHLDASVLLIPLVGFLPAEDERVRATVKAIDRELGDGPFVRRWAGEPNGFLLTSFWMVQCLALEGRLEEARERFDALCGCANDLGLLAEMVEPALGRQLGNFPQVFSHVGLVNAAWAITEAEQEQQRLVPAGVSL